ncbi:MAG: hypothetical protein K2G03_04800 [Bacilli bacterium]|nr:hypothetical protein [Bacilli bacterium]
MKGTNKGKVITQNEGALEVLYNQTYQKIMDYINKTEDVLDDNKTISAYSLYSILKNYYAGLDVAMGSDSEELKTLVEDINSYVANGYRKVVSVKKSSKLISGFVKLIGRLRDSKQMESMPKRYLGVRFYIRQDATSAVLDVLEDNKYKKVILCRDVASDEIYYGENSVEDYEVIDFAYDRLIELFDTIDAYRESLPEQIDADLALDDYACKPYEYAKYSAPILSDMVSGEVFVNSNGYVDFDINLTRENSQYHYINDYSRSVKELIRACSMDLLKKVPVDINKIQEPLKAIVEANLTNNRNLQKNAG